MIGDGYTVVRHCEFADVPSGTEPDAEPVYCTPDALPNNCPGCGVQSGFRHRSGCPEIGWP